MDIDVDLDVAVIEIIEMDLHIFKLIHTKI